MDKEFQTLMELALRMQDISPRCFTWAEAHQFALTYNLVKEKGDQFNLKDAANVMAQIEDIYAEDDAVSAA